MSTIAAGTTLTTALVNTGDTSGQLVFQTNGTTTAMTIGTNQVVSLAQPLPVASGGTGATSLSGITAGSATNLAGGGAGQVPYNTGAGATSFVSAGSSGQAFLSNGSSAPSWGTLGVGAGGTGQTSLTSNNIILGNGTSAVNFVAPGTSGNVLTSNGTTWTSGTTSVAGGGTGQTSLTANNVILGNGASAVQFVAPGTNGNVLTSNGTTWQSTAPAGGGSWTYLAAVTASNSSGANLDYAFSTTYDMYVVVGVGIYMSGAFSLGVRFRFNGSTETASNYNYGSYSNNGTSFRAETGQATYLFLTDNSVWPIGSNSAVTSSFILYLPSAGSTSIRKSMFGQILSNSNPNIINFSGNYSAAISSTTALSGVQIFPLSGGVYGTFRLYGIKNS